MKVAPVKKAIYSLPLMRELMGAANRRYLNFISELDDPTAGLKRLLKISKRVRDHRQRSHRGFNLFDGDDLKLFEAIMAGEFTISGFMNRHLRAILPKLGMRVVATALKLRRLYVIPALAQS